MRNGRLICQGEYFGHPGPAYKASLNNFIGELNLPRQVPVLPNKTDFDRDSPEWDEVQTRMHELIKPDIEELLKQPDEDKVTKEEKRRVRAVRNTMMKAINLLIQEGQANPFGAEGQGRKPPEPRPATGSVRGVAQQPAAPRLPRTAPPSNAAGRLRRLSAMPNWTVDVLAADIRSDWRDEGSTRLLVINKKFPLCEARDIDELYIAETAALELAKPPKGEEKPISEYTEDVNGLMRAFCVVWAES